MRQLRQDDEDLAADSRANPTASRRNDRHLSLRLDAVSDRHRETSHICSMDKTLRLPPLTSIYGVADAVKRNGTVKQTSPDLEKVWRGLLFLALNHASLV